VNVVAGTGHLPYTSAADIHSMLVHVAAAVLLLIVHTTAHNVTH